MTAVVLPLNMRIYNNESETNKCEWPVKPVQITSMKAVQMKTETLWTTVFVKQM